MRANSAAGLQASRLQSTARAPFSRPLALSMRDASNPARGRTQLLDCRRLACRARDVLLFQGVWPCRCGTHRIRQEVELSCWIAGVSPAEHGTCSFFKEFGLVDAGRIESDVRSNSAVGLQASRLQSTARAPFSRPLALSMRDASNPARVRRIQSDSPANPARAEPRILVLRTCRTASGAKPLKLKVFQGRL